MAPRARQRPGTTLFSLSPLADVVRGNRVLAGALIALALAAALAPAASAQVFVDPEERHLELTAGETTTTNVTIVNPTNRSYVVQATASGNLSEATEVTPHRFDLGREAERSVTVAISPPAESDFVEGNLHLDLQFIDRDTGESTRRTETISLETAPPLLYLGTFDNPLPEAYQGAGWLFALEAVTWFAMAAVLASLCRVVTNRIVPRAPDGVQAEMAGKIRWPISALPIVLGGSASWRLLPRTPLVDGLGTLLEALGIVAVALVAYRLVSAGLVYYRERSADTRFGRGEGVLLPVLEKLSAATVIVLTGFFLLRTLDIDVSFLVGGGLVAGLVISMAAQDTLANFFSGLHILLDQPFREGDVLQLESGEVCRVERIGMRSTTLYHFENHQQIIAPNNDLATNRIVNMSYPDSQHRLVVPVGVAYGTDLEEAKQIVYEIAMEVDEVIKGRNTKPKVFVREFGDSAIQLELRAFVPNERDRFPAKTKLVQRIHEAFEEADITIPFPQRVLHVEDGADVPGSSALDDQAQAPEEAPEVDGEGREDADGA